MADAVVVDGQRAKSPTQLKTADELAERLRSLKNARGSMENQWKLNLAFYKGRQYVYINKSMGELRALPTDEGEKPRYRVRMTSNQIIVGSHSLLAKFTKTKPVITASPGSASQGDFKAAQMAERLVEFWWEDFALDDRLEEALLWSIIAGQGYWKISWDPYASKQMRFTLDPEGQPIVDDKIKEYFEAQMAQMGVPLQEKVVNLGDIKVEAMSPFDVYLDPGAKTFDECKFAICVHTMSKEEIKERWKVDVEPDAAPAEPDSILSFNQGVPQEHIVKHVYFGYFLPGAGNPNGRYVVWIESPNQILEDTKWPYPINKLPLVKFPGLRTPGAVYDGSYVEQAIPLQKELNRTLSQLIEYKNLTVKPRVWAPTGSLRQRITTEPGAVYEYNPVAGLKPEVEKLPTIPPYVFEHLEQISGRLKEIFALTEVSEGSVPPNVEAGIAIDLLQELSADRLAPTIKLIEKQLARAGQIMLSMAQTYYHEARLLHIRGTGGASQVKKFSKADIAGNVTISVETGSGLPRTRAGRQAQIERWISSGIIPPDKAWKYIDMADLKGLAAQFQADEEQANRELDKLLSGAPINPEAVQEAMGAVNQGINPETGEPLESPEQAQDLLFRASLKPKVGENYDVHLDVLGLFMKGVEFEALPIDVRQRVIMHFQLTQEARGMLPVQTEPGKLNTNLQIKATLGPTAASKILNQQGVQVSPNEMAEPPLETWVSDSVDKPDADASGPGQEANQLSQAAKIMIESDAKIADAAIAAQLRKTQEMRDQESHDQGQAVDIAKAAADAEIQGHAIRKAAADADLAERKAKETSFAKPDSGKKK